ncbi:MAG: four helix bundle protein [Ignavibacteriales bacterium]|nr:four helix bundle protein [Ignavibacteriales bacterium]
MSATWDLKQRTKEFSIRIIQISEKLPGTKANHVLCNQLLRSGTSIGANYRAACIARSKREFLAKLQIAREEADETQYWVELLAETNSGLDDHFGSALKEAMELTAILTSALKTARESLNK